MQAISIPYIQPKGVVFMILLSIGYSKDNRSFYDRIKELSDYLKPKGVSIAIGESDVGGMHYIKCFLKDTAEDFMAFEGARDMFYTYAAGIIYSFIAQEYESEIAERILKESYRYLEEDDYRQIRDRSIEVITGSTLSMHSVLLNMNRRNSILRKIEDYIKENTELILDGFITFRLKEINEELGEIIERVAEDYAVEKEYSEFIKLLKYFVDIQDERYDKIDIVIDRSGAYSIYTSEGKNISEEFFEDFKAGESEGEISTHDMLISAVITNAPGSICIHGAEYCQCAEVVETIKSIFQDRVTLCSGCSLCSIENYMENNIKLVVDKPKK